MRALIHIAALCGLLASGVAASAADAAAEQAGAKPVPDQAAQATALKGIKEVYKADYARRKPDEHALLARTLLDRGQAAGDDPAACYVFLHEACDQAAKAGDAALIEEAMAALAKGFQIKAPEEHLKALGLAGANAASLEAATAIDEAELGIALAAIEDDDFALAAKAAHDAEAYARTLNDAPLSARAHALAERAKSLGEDYKQVGDVFDLLGNVDYDGHLRLGIFYCFSKDDWSRGLAHLAAGSDGPLKLLAAAELAANAPPPAPAPVAEPPAVAKKPRRGQPTDAASAPPVATPPDTKTTVVAEVNADALLKVADGWWDYAQKQRTDPKEAIIAHAVGWYRRAASALAGAAKARVDRRIEDAERLLANSVRHPLAHFPPGAVLLLTFERESLVLQGDKLVGVLDVSGHGLHGVVTGAKPVSGAFGSALAFDGSSHIDLGNQKEFQITGSQSIAFWIKPAALDERRNPFMKSYGGEGTITLEPSGVLSYFYGTAGGNAEPYMSASSEKPLIVKQWSHMVVVRDLTAKKIWWYKDGKRCSETAAQYPAASTTTLPVLIGTGYTNPFLGQLDDFGLWPRALSEAEVVQLYEAGSAGRK